MTDADRGAYTPSTDAPLSFDARQPVRGARPVPFTLIISGLVLIALVAAIYVFYQGGVRQAGDAPQTVGAPVGDLRGEGPPEQAAIDPAAGLQIYRTDAGEAPAGEPRFAPPPEQPAPRPVAVEAAPAAAPTTPVSSQPVPLPPAPKPAPPVQVATAPKAPPAPAPVPKAAPPAPAPKVATAPAPAPKTAAPAAGGGSAAVQIGAFTSRELAQAELAKVAGVSGNPGGRSVEPAPGKPLFRAAVTGFSSRADAQAFCNALKSSGKQCFVR
ncbi:SPOR domain-containing protein [Phenylobacterium sp.]|jgi:outer membrane biosynthesis protein TonB|uniref:SPOR domain-containing protein n=1 Tax=Phenylobacterium sp. TaxID=1871053 RepID=UPI002E2FABAA|nr:SPOR domain-containing protein [Phenylobacterium sp.]HEX2560728.1 SPOR domain-containing protein [Phenylobacterium sp.]